jgi:integral membrane sensor domain MASE1
LASYNFTIQESCFPQLHRVINNTLTRFLTWGNLSCFVVVVVSYFITGKLGLQLAVLNPSVTVLWAPTGIAIAALLLRGKQAWPAVFLGAFLVDVTTTRSTSTSIGIAFGNSLEALTAAYLVSKFANGIEAFRRPRDVLRFVFLAGMVSTMVSATIGVSLLCLNDLSRWADFWRVWSVWWVGDALGALLLTPFLVLLFGHEHPALSLTEMLESTVLLFGLSIVCVLIFGPPMVSWIPKVGLLYLVFPFLVWSALRFCPLEATGTMLVMGGFALWGSVHGYGPYANTSEAPFFAIGYLPVASTITMVIAAAAVQQRKETADLLELYYKLKEVNGLGVGPQKAKAIQ